MGILKARQHHLYPNLLIIFPILVHIVGTILQDCLFGGLISFLYLLFPNLDLVNDIGTDVLSPCHIQNLLDIRVANQTTLLDYLNYLRYPQKSLNCFFDNCNFIVPFKLLYTWNLIDICENAYWNNLWEWCQVIGK